MKSIKIKVGDVVEVTFWDHCMHPYLGEEAPQGLLFNAYGKVISITENFVTIASWVNPTGEPDGNTEVYDIVRTALTKIRRLR